MKGKKLSIGKIIQYKGIHLEVIHNDGKYIYTTTAIAINGCKSVFQPINLKKVKKGKVKLIAQNKEEYRAMISV